MSFFRSFPDAVFQFDGKSFNLEDVTRRVIFEPKSFSNYSYIYDIDVGDARPDVVSHLLYGNVNFWWSFFIVNNITMNEWPLSDVELEEYMDEKYTDFQLNKTYRYIDKDGEEVPEFGLRSFVADGERLIHGFSPDAVLNPGARMSRSNGTKQTLRDFLIAQNDKRRLIRAVRAEFIGQFFEDFRKRVKSAVDLG